MDCPPEEDRAPETAEVVAPGAPVLDSSPVQESPFSNYMSNLSPIKSAKTANVWQAFHRIDTSPLVFASPTVRSQPRKNRLKMSRMFESANVGISHDVRKDDSADSSQKLRELVVLSENASNGVNLFEADCAKSTHSQGFDCEGDSTKGFGSKDAALRHVSPNESNQDAEKLFTGDGPTAVAEEYHETEPSISVKCDVAKGDLLIDDGGNQAGIDSVSDIKESQLRPPFYPFQDSEVNENCGEGAPSESLRLLDDAQHHEVIQQQNFLLRRCLRFDDMHLDASLNSPVPLSDDVHRPGPLAMEDPENSNLPEVTSTCMKTSAVLTSCDGKRSAMPINKPSGIGLHLNSIVGARSIDSRETIRTKYDKDSQGGRCLKSIGSGTAKLLDRPIDFPHSVDLGKFTKAQEFYGTPPLDKRTLPLGFAEAEFAQSAKRRRKASNTSESDGCKRCSCKKSRCLKLYCDCFAAGLFCTEPCACQGCLNRFEEQEAVLAARELIESRNPLAFAPKIVHNNKELDAAVLEDGLISTPSSARHKKGCNCKRSKCQKKYCECYQANVGCSDNCRCEGCKNVFGTKEDFSVARELSCRIVCDASLEGMSNVKMAMVGTYSRDHLVPPTPSIQFSDHRKGIQKSRLAIECLSPSSPAKSGAAGWSSELQSEISKESPTLATIADFIDPDFSEQVDEFSTKHASLGSSSNLAPPLSPTTTMRSSSESSKAESALFATRLGVEHPPSRFLWRGGSLETSGILSGGKNSHHDDKPCGNVYKNLDDDAPGVSKDVLSPTKPVIISSPSRKRVSSPHKQVQEHCLTPSTALRSGGKFILKAIPSFPPLTPQAEPRNEHN